MTEEDIDSLENFLTSNQPIGMDKIQSKMKGVGQIDQKLFFYLFAICTRWFEANTVDIDASSFCHKKDNFDVLSKWQWPSLVRLYLLLLIAKRNTKEDYIHLYTSLFNAADVQESIVLIQSLAFIPYPEAFAEKVREAARSNITILFNTVAHNNCYAFKYFDNSGWNQLVLKAAFLGVSIINIHGLKSRNNSSLVDMLRDYARERQVALRSVPWDLWCCVAWAAKSDDCYESLKIEFLRGDIKTKAAITLALSENQNEHAVSLAQKFLNECELNPALSPLTWEIIQNYKC